MVRRSFIDAIVASCIPVVFQNDSVLFDSLPYADTIPYHEMVLHLPIMDELTAEYAVAHNSRAAKVRSGERRARRQGQLMDTLDAVPADVIERKRALLRRFAPLLSYPYPKMLAARRARDGSETAGIGRDAMVAARRGPNAVTMAMERLAAEVAPEP